MSTKQLLSFLPGIIVSAFGIASLNIWADENVSGIAYTQASMSNLRANNKPAAEIMLKLPINSAVKILGMEGDLVKVETDGAASVTGWVHHSLLAESPLTLHKAYHKFLAVPDADPSRLKWIERAAAISPHNLSIIKDLISTLHQLGEHDRANRAWESFKRHNYVADNTDEKSWSYLYPTMTHEGESPVHPGTGWLALRKGSGGWELVETKIGVKILKSEITDFDVEISSHAGDAIAMFKDPLLLPGPVASVDLPEGLTERTFYMPYDEPGKNDGFEHNMVFKGIPYKIFYDEKEEQHGDYKYKTFAIILKSGEQTALLGHETANYYAGDDDAVRVLWAGDIDRDNKLDVITSFSAKNSGGSCVHLSAGSKNGRLFGSHQCHWGSGC